MRTRKKIPPSTSGRTSSMRTHDGAFSTKTTAQRPRTATDMISKTRSTMMEERPWEMVAS